MTPDPAFVAFLEDDALALEIRVDQSTVAIPAPCRAGVIDNLALLQAQARLVVGALVDAGASALPETFTP